MSAPPASGSSRSTAPATTITTNRSSSPACPWAAAKTPSTPPAASTSTIPPPGSNPRRTYGRDHLASCYALPTAATLAMSRSVPPRNGSTPTVLLVHGAFADGSMWAGVITELQAAGIGVIAVASPLRSLTSDAAYVASVAAEIDGPILLAGHDYGGAVITAAGSAAGNVAGLVYVAAFALDEGESALDITSRFPGSQLMPALRPATFPGADGDPAVELYIDQDAYPRVFAADLPYRCAAAAAAAQRPITA